MAELYEVVAPIGMARNPDHKTSIIAAAKVKRVTLRNTVLAHADQCGVYGFIDDDLKRIWHHTPESSLRKRRTELTQENWLLDTGCVRKNRKGQDEKVWRHRNHVFNPPSIVERQQHESKDAQIARLKALLDAHGIAY